MSEADRADADAVADSAAASGPGPSTPTIGAAASTMGASSRARVAVDESDDAVARAGDRRARPPTASPRDPRGRWPPSGIVPSTRTIDDRRGGRRPVEELTAAEDLVDAAPAGPRRAPGPAPKARWPTAATGARPPTRCGCTSRRSAGSRCSPGRGEVGWPSASRPGRSGRASWPTSPPPGGSTTLEFAERRRLARIVRTTARTPSAS